MKKRILVSIVIVSHGQRELVAKLLESLQGCFVSNFPVEIIILENLLHHKLSIPADFPFPIRVIKNQHPSGLSKNLNQAFKFVQGEYFCTINPDIEFTSNIIDSLIRKMQAESIDIIAPTIVDDDSSIQDSFRSIPTPKELFLRRFLKRSCIVIPEGARTIFPDWLAGMFLLMKSKTFQELAGFDEKFYLYFEDADFCCRATLSGFVVALDVETRVIHHAQRKSRKSLRFFLIHLSSTLKFFYSPVYREYQKQRANK